MKILNLPDEKVAYDRPTVVAIGVFDGVHIGHQALLTEAKERARKLDADLAVLLLILIPPTLFAPRTLRCS